MAEVEDIEDIDDVPGFIAQSRAQGLSDEAILAKVDARNLRFVRAQQPFRVPGCAQQAAAVHGWLTHLTGVRAGTPSGPLTHHRCAGLPSIQSMSRWPRSRPQTRPTS